MSEISQSRLAFAMGLLLTATLLAPACKDKSVSTPGAGATAPTKATTAKPAAPPASETASSDFVARAMAERRLDHWYGMYLGGKKLGYAQLQARPTREGEPGAFVNSLEAVIVADGDENRLTDVRYYAGKAPYGIVEIRAAEHSGDSAVQRRYVPEGRQLTVHTTIDGKEQPVRTISGTEETAWAVFAPFPDPESVSPGHRVNYAVFDLDEEEDEHHIAVVTEVRTERLAGVATRVAVLEDRTEGEQSVTESRVARGGVVLSASMGGIAIKLEEKAVAQSKVEGFDMIADATPIQRDLGEPSDIERLALVVGVTAPFQPPDAPNQRVSKRTDGRFDVVIRSIPGADATPEERRDALAETQDVDWRTPAIGKKAREIVAGATTDRERVEKLISWLYGELEKTLTSNVSTASQVLERMAGDCTEHALLFTALARSLGIPARSVGGVIYVGDDFRRFGWHAWNEVILDGKWVQVDPTWDESIANATHLKLGVEGADDSAMAMGSLTIEVSGVN